MINNYVSWIVCCFLILAGADLIGGQKDMKAKDYYEGPTPYVYEMHKLYGHIAKYAEKDLKLHLCGAGGTMMNGIHGVDLNFQSEKEMTEDEVLVAFRKILDSTLDYANHNEIIREACDNKEMSVNMVRLFLLINKGKGNKGFDSVDLWKGKVRFNRDLEGYNVLVLKEVNLEQ